MLRRPRSNVRTFITQRIEIFPEILNIRLGKFIDRNAARVRLVDDPIVNVRQIKDVRQLVTLELQIPPQNVTKNERSKVADMREIPNRRPAHIHPDLVVAQSLEFLDL